MKVTVAICTHGRARILRETLASLARVRVRAGTEPALLVVDNGSRDRTAEVVREAAPRFPPPWSARLVAEPAIGLSRARNRALDEAVGELLLFADDDVLFDAGWLESFVAAARAAPEASYFGGRILPLFEGPPPAWAREHLGLLTGPLALYDYGEGTLVRRAGDPRPAFKFPYGASFGLRLAEVARLGLRFDYGRGVAGRRRGVGEEWDLLGRLEAAGAAGVYCGAAVLRHRVPLVRLRERYLWRWYAGAGATCRRVDERPAGGARRPALVPAWALAELARALPAYLAERLGGRSSAGWLHAMRRPAWLLGYLREGWGARAAA